MFRAICISVYSPGIIQLGTLHCVVQRFLIVPQVHIANCPVEVCLRVVRIALDGFVVLPALPVVWELCRWQMVRDACPLVFT